MPQLGTYGSVRGVPGNRHPYRYRRQPRKLNVSGLHRLASRGQLVSSKQAATWGPSIRGVPCPGLPESPAILS